MTVLETATIAITMDEPALSLWEGVLTAPDYRGRFRYQIIRVIRQDRPAEFRLNMGPDALWTGPDGFHIPGGDIVLMDGTMIMIPAVIPYEKIRRITIVHTVGELRDMADIMRDAPSRLLQIEPRDMLSDLRTQNQDFLKWDRFVSTFGYGGQTIRDTIH